MTVRPRLVPFLARNFNGASEQQSPAKKELLQFTSLLAAY
jgi:hypothetical protein